MRVFVSAGEPSGDLHGANLIRELRTRQPNLDFEGFGGDRMVDAGCDLLYPLADLALMGVWRVLKNLPEIRRVYYLAYDHFREHRPDVVVMIDYPGFHWWLARAAKKHGIPVVYFVPPQLWAWASYRVRKMRRLTDLVLSTLPFERDWFEERGVTAQFVGHPYFDELREQRLDGEFIAQQRQQPGEIISLLPGSRTQEVEYNTPSLLRAASLIHAQRPDVRFLVACYNEKQRAHIVGQASKLSLPIEMYTGHTPEIIQLAHSCLSCSGSVGLELLYRGKPSVIMYLQFWLSIFLAKRLMNCKYMSLVNLLAGHELFPEYLSGSCRAESMSKHILHWLHNRDDHEAIRGKLAQIREQVAEPGACGRAADAVLELMRGRQRRAA